ncbi:MAG: acetyltransferase [Magnetococcales bacterium]|nr:acetyltransferase [Magnetococcales bacterium]
MPIQWILLGCGGHGRVLLSILQGLGWKDRLVGMFDPDPNLPDMTQWQVPMLEDDLYLSIQFPQGIQLLNGLGSVANTARRRELYLKFRSQGYDFATLCHPSAWIADSANLGAGVQVMAGAILQAGCQLGENVLINTRAVVEHDCLIQPHVHVATGALLCGHVWVGEGAHIGAGATVIQGVKIGAHACVGAGAVVIRDVPNGAKVVGVPAREYRK